MVMWSHKRSLRLREGTLNVIGRVDLSTSPYLFCTKDGSAEIDSKMEDRCHA